MQLACSLPSINFDGIVGLVYLLINIFIFSYFLLGDFLLNFLYSAELILLTCSLVPSLFEFSLE